MKMIGFLILACAMVGAQAYCVEDNRDRVLHGGYIVIRDNTPERCIAACKAMPKADDMPDTNKGFKYAGAQIGFQCFCGNWIPFSVLKPEKECNTPCPGDKRQKCGGYWRMSIYPTGL
eukprot:GFUD01006322.1.p1 GENE.GFUD01006322.1~~GFUD01006322.1.p1  ORF type:complete len:118 (-),score=1.60 GFUD01006322.1:162-515(-)